MYVMYILNEFRSFDTLPIFTRHLKNVRCCDGDSVRLECHVSAQPKPHIVWKKDDVELSEYNIDISTKYENGHAVLTINHIYAEDEGEYKCIATNSSGTSISVACIVVDGKPNNFFKNISYFR